MHDSSNFPNLLSEKTMKKTFYSYMERVEGKKYFKVNAMQKVH